VLRILKGVNYKFLKILSGFQKSGNRVFKIAQPGVTEFAKKPSYNDRIATVNMIYVRCIIKYVPTTSALIVLGFSKIL